MKPARTAIAAFLLVSLLQSPLAAADSPWVVEPGHRNRALELQAGAPGFTALTPAQTGIAFTNQLAEWSGAANRVLLNGSGVAVGDFDNDGRPDLFFCGLETPNALYRNLGNWKFENVTAQSGLNFAGNFFRGAVFVDLDGDRWLELLVTVTGRGVLCFKNEQGKFRDITAQMGTGSTHGSVALALADVDGNGSLDLYVGNNRSNDIRDRGQVDLQLVRGQVVIPPQFQDRLLFTNKLLIELGEPDQLFLNDGQGRLRPAPWNSGLFLDEGGQPLGRAPLDWALTATFRDVNNDGWPDLYVCNDYWTPDRFWINDGKGRFRAIEPFAWRNMSASSMGVDFADLDRDGSPEFFVVDMLSRDPRLRKRQTLAQMPELQLPGLFPDRPQFMRNTLFHNRGDGTFAEIAHFSGLSAADWAWCPIFLDVDLDGLEDVLITAGHVKDVQDLDAEAVIKTRQKSYRGFTNVIERQQAFTEDKMHNERLYPYLSMPIVAFRNQGGLRFEEKTDGWGTQEKGVHHGFATGDFDGDGDLDLVVNSLGTPARVLRNNAGGARVAVRLRGRSPNTQGIGARVRLLGGAVPLQSQEMISGGRYLSGGDPYLCFASGPKKSGMTLEVSWRSGRVSSITNVQPNRLYEIEEEGASTSPAPKAIPMAWFVESSNFAHPHLENSFDDYARQPLLPFKLSQSGPGLAAGDLNQDGHLDLIIGHGGTNPPVALLGEGNGQFVRQPLAVPSGPREWTSVLIWPASSTNRVILLAGSNYESGQSNTALVTAYDFQQRKVLQEFGPAGSAGPMALGDLEGDGELELFVGGQAVGGRYPESHRSFLFRRQQGQWIEDKRQNFSAARLVNGSCFSDLNGDGFPELILATSWGPIRVYRPRQGVLEDITTNLGLSSFTGLWNGVTTGDVDGDGDLDLVASNWGLNSEFRAEPARGLQLFHGDLLQRNQVDLFETEWMEETPAPNRLFKDLVAGVPSLIRQFKTHKIFSEQSLDQFLGADSRRLRRETVSHLASTLFLNQGTGFVARLLPMQAQWAPAFGVNLADLNGDGYLDIFLAQNFFPMRPTHGRIDAGRGLVLEGQGNGEFVPVSGTASGIKVYGEQRASVIGDFNGDGRMDLVVSQNGAPTKFYLKLAGSPAWRIRLKGLPGNEEAIGATIRWKKGNQFGPLQEIKAGSGYWSQDSAAFIALPATAESVLVKWPGGKISERPLTGPASEIQLAFPP